MGFKYTAKIEIIGKSNQFSNIFHPDFRIVLHEIFCMLRRSSPTYLLGVILYSALNRVDIYFSFRLKDPEISYM